MNLNIDHQRYDEIYNYLKNNTLPPVAQSTQYKFKRRYSSYRINQKDEVVDGQGRILVRKDQVPRILQRLYDDPLTSRNGVYSFTNQVASRYVGISQGDVQKFLKKQENYQVHNNYIKQHIVVKPIQSTKAGCRVQMDLIVLDKLASKNNGYKYILMIIDHFTKYLHSCLLYTSRCV